MTTLMVQPDGRVQGLYTEAIELAAIGRLRIERATSIEFDNELQTWCVFNGYGQCLHSHPSRQECLLWEEQYFGRE
ncbi:MAG: hypothetical protein HY298_20935 [Verrucomicrobia bacterium]|nr:hypothetical protein [Verrucomicrobiota bacterium]